MNVLFALFRQKIQDYPVLFLVGLFAVTRLFFLTNLPIFNDEAIYLDWGWRTVNVPGDEYFPLFDGKQPFLMWVFGYAQSMLGFLGGPLLAGRLVSVFTGALTCVGLYLFAKKYFHLKTAYWCVLLYIVTPIFVFFDRQALMESAVGCVGVWSMYLLFEVLFEKKATKIWTSAIALGILLGIGMFVKSSGLVFLLCSLFVTAIWFWKNTHQETMMKRHSLRAVLLSLLLSQLVLLPLYAQPQASLIWSLNTRFTLSITEVLALPTAHWGRNILSTVEILFWHLSPISFILLCIGVGSQIKKLHHKHDAHFPQTLFSVWLSSALAIFLITIRYPSPRYISALLPLSCVLIVHGGNTIIGKYAQHFHRHLSSVFQTVMYISPVVLSLLLIFSPLQYFSLYHSVTRFSQKDEYVVSWPSGYGVGEAIEYVKQKSLQSNRVFLVWVRPDSGNPENAVFTFFHNNPRSIVSYLEPYKILSRLHDPDCESPQTPVYFISRDHHLMNLEAFFVEEARFYKPEQKNYVAVHRLKKMCQGQVREE